MFFGSGFFPSRGGYKLQIALAGRRTGLRPDRAGVFVTSTVLLYRVYCMENDYYSIDSILSENQVLVLSSAHVLHVRIPYNSQKIQCTFKVDIPDMGHLDGGHERDVRPTKPLACIPSLLTHARRTRSNPRAKSSSRSGSPSFLSIRASGRPPHTHNLRMLILLICAGITQISPSHPRSVRACAMRSMPRLRA